MGGLWEGLRLLITIINHGVALFMGGLGGFSPMLAREGDTGAICFLTRVTYGNYPNPPIEL